MEHWLIDTVQAELAEHRTVMVYIEQITRSMAKRLEWVFKQGGISSWTLPHATEAEDRDQAILDALNVDNHNVVIVPYRLVNEGLNLHNLPNRRGIKTIIWYEPIYLFMYLQASQVPGGLGLTMKSGSTCPSTWARLLIARCASSVGKVVLLLPLLGNQQRGIDQTHGS